MSQFMTNTQNTAMYLSGETWALVYTKAEVDLTLPPPSGDSGVTLEKKTKKARVAATGSIILNNGKLATKPTFSEIGEGLYRFSKLTDDSPVWGDIIADTNDARKSYKNLHFFYKASVDATRIKGAMQEGDIIEFVPIGRLCQGGYNVSAERQTQQVSNSCGSFVLPLAQINKTGTITAIFPEPFDEDGEGFSYTLFRNQFMVVNQKQGEAIEIMMPKMEKIKFFFLLFTGSVAEAQYQTVVNFQGFLMTNTLGSDVSQAALSFDSPVSIESDINLLNHDYYANQLFGI